MEQTLNSESASTKSVCILVYGSDDVLLGTRTMVLEKAGYTVFSARDPSDFQEILLGRTISLLVLCHSLSAEMCAAAIEFAENRHPVTRCLELTAGDSPCSERAHDAVLSALDGPRKLVETVQHLLQHASSASLR
jgi:DNA-binding response OmpR family regulator